MPFDLILSRATRPIASDELAAVMSGAPAARKGDHVYWVRYPDGDPWFAVEWRPDGTVVLSTSYTNPRFLRNFPDMFDQGLRIAQQLEARMVEEVNQTTVTRKNVDSLLAPNGRYVQLQADTWRHAVEQMITGGHAPLELPIGPVDLVGEFLVFHVAPAQPIAIDGVTALLEHAGAGIGVTVQSDQRTWLVLDRADKKWLTRVLHRDDGIWQVWPAWGMSAFSRIAAVTVAAAEALAAAGAAELHFLGLPYDEALRAEVRARIGGLGVDFYLWTQGLDIPRA